MIATVFRVLVAGVLALAAAGCGAPEPAESTPAPVRSRPTPVNVPPPTPVKRRPPRPLPQPPGPTIRIELAMVEGKCVLTVNGEHVGHLPEAREELTARVSSLNRDPDRTLGVLAFAPRVPQEHVNTVVAACTAARLTRLRLAQPVELPPRKGE